MLLFLLFFLNFFPDTANSYENTVPEMAHTKAAVADTSSYFIVIDKVFIIGNKRTRDQIITRELEFKQNDTIRVSDLDLKLLQNKNRIFNLGLFTHVDLNVIYLTATRIDIVVNLKERWFTFPVPIFKLADRNFNDWWENQNRDLRRVDYGIKFYQFNMRGRNESLRATAQLGFNKLFDLQYSIPYIDKKQINGLSLFTTYAENNSIAYQTSEHKLIFLNTDSRVRQTFRTGATLSHRQSFFSYHYLTLAYYHRSIGDTIAALNPDYFLNGMTKQKYFYFNYRFKRDLRNIAAYPLTGYLLNLEFEKSGLGIIGDINLFEISGNYAKYMDLGKNFYLSSKISTAFSLPRVQPYYNFTSLGYQQEYIRGFELYVIEGQNYILNKTTFKKLLFSGSSTNTLIPIEQFQTIPFSIYLKSYFDWGFVNNERFYPMNTRLANKYLYGGGFGLDIVTYYDMVIRLEYSLNSINERGFVIGAKAEF
jgi:outer membrane protein assembly factor BamA